MRIHDKVAEMEITKKKIGFLVSLFILFLGNILHAQQNFTCDIESKIQLEVTPRSCLQSEIEVWIEEDPDDKGINCGVWHYALIEAETNDTIQGPYRFGKYGEPNGKFNNLSPETYNVIFKKDDDDQLYYWNGSGITPNSSQKEDIEIESDYQEVRASASFTGDPICPKKAGSNYGGAHLTVKVTGGGGGGPFIYKVEGDDGSFEESDETDDTEYTFTDLKDGESVTYSITDLSCGGGVTKNFTYKLPLSNQTAKPEKIKLFFKRDCATDGYTTQIAVEHDSTPGVDQKPGTLHMEVTGNGPNAGQSWDLTEEDLVDSGHVFEFRFQLPVSLEPGEMINAVYETDCWPTLEKSTTVQPIREDIFNPSPSKNFGYQEVVVIGGECSIQPTLYLNAIHTLKGDDYDMLCADTPIKVYREVPDDSGNFEELEGPGDGLDFRGITDPVSYLGGMRWNENPLNNGNTELVLGDLGLEDGGTFKVVLVDQKLDTVSEVLEVPPVQETDQIRIEDVVKGYSLMEGSGGLAINFNSKGTEYKGVFHVIIEPDPKSSIPNGSFENPEFETGTMKFVDDKGNNANMSYNFPIEFDGSPDRNDQIKVGDLPPGKYKISVQDKCAEENNKIFSYEIKSSHLVHYDPEVKITPQCNGDDLHYDLRHNSNMRNYGVKKLFRAKSNGKRGTGLNVSGVNSQDYKQKYSDVPNFTEIGDFIMVHADAGASSGTDGFYSAVNKANGYKKYKRDIEIPVTVKPHKDLQTQLRALCYIENDTKKAQIEVGISSGTLIYPIRYNVLDEEGEVVDSYTAESEGDKLSHTFKDLEPFTYTSTDTIPNTYNIELIPGYKGNGRGCSSRVTLAEFHCEEIADLEIVKTGDPAPPEKQYIDMKEDPIIHFTLTVENHGPETSSQNFVQDIFPDGFEYVRHEPESASYNLTNSKGDDIGEWKIGKLRVGQKVELIIFGKMKKQGDYLNRATVYPSAQHTIEDPYERTAEAEIIPAYHLLKVNPALMNHNPEPKTESSDPP